MIDLYFINKFITSINEQIQNIVTTIQAFVFNIHYGIQSFFLSIHAFVFNIIQFVLGLPGQFIVFIKEVLGLILLAIKEFKIQIWNFFLKVFEICVYFLVFPFVFIQTVCHMMVEAFIFPTVQMIANHLEIEIKDVDFVQKNITNTCLVLLAVTIANILYISYDNQRKIDENPLTINKQSMTIY